MKEYNIDDFGAKINQLSTNAIQSAIDQCAVDGGGVVLITHGTYISGTIFMKSNVHLRIDAGWYVILLVQ